MPIDLTYGRVELEHGAVGDDEPVVVFRAQDSALLPALSHYRTLCKYTGSPPHHIDAIGRAMATIGEWQQNNPTQMRQSAMLAVSVTVTVMPERETSVPLRKDLLQRLRMIESHALSIAIDRLSVPVMVQQAVLVFLPPLVAAVDRNESIDLPLLLVDYDYDYVDLDARLVAEIDRVVAHAVTHGNDAATRGRLVSSAVRAYLDGFEVKLAGGS